MPEDKKKKVSLETSQANCQVNENISQTHYLRSWGTKVAILFVTKFFKKAFNWLHNYVEGKLEFLKKKKKGQVVCAVKTLSAWSHHALCKGNAEGLGQNCIVVTMTS